LAEVLEIHHRIVKSSGGAGGLRDLGALQSAVVQPRATFSGKDLYPSLAEKAASLCYSLVLNHPFVDGNKRVGHAATEVFLILNGHEIEEGVAAAEQLMLGLAGGRISRSQLLEWLRKTIRPKNETAG
jgi:death-on-curing protein